MSIRKLLPCLISFMFILSACAGFLQGSQPPPQEVPAAPITYVYEPTLDEQELEPELEPVSADEYTVEENEMHNSEDSSTVDDASNVPEQPQIAQPPDVPRLPPVQAPIDSPHPVLKGSLFHSDLSITVSDVGLIYSLRSNYAEKFFSGIDLSRLTPAQGSFEGIGFNNAPDPDNPADPNFEFRPAIRFISAGFMYQLKLDQEANIAHFVISERPGERTFESFYHMPPGFYDEVMNRVLEFQQYSAH